MAKYIDSDRDQILCAYQYGSLLLYQVGSLHGIATNFAKLDPWLDTPTIMVTRTRLPSGRYQTKKRKCAPRQQMDPVDEESLYRHYAMVIRQRRLLLEVLHPVLNKIRASLPLDRAPVRGWDGDGAPFWPRVLSATALEAVDELADRCLSTLPQGDPPFVWERSDPLPDKLECFVEDAVEPVWIKSMSPRWRQAPSFDVGALQVKLDLERSWIMNAWPSSDGPTDLITQVKAAKVGYCGVKLIRDRIDDKTLRSFGPRRKVSKAEVVAKRELLRQRAPKKPRPKPASRRAVRGP